MKKQLSGMKSITDIKSICYCMNRALNFKSLTARQMAAKEMYPLILCDNGPVSCGLLVT